MNSVTIIVGVFLVSFGLVVHATGLRKSLKNPNYHPTTVWFLPISLGAIFFLDGLFI